jgi:hypothetical protein
VVVIIISDPCTVIVVVGSKRMLPSSLPALVLSSSRS